jgi:hypothetical protein
MNNDDVWIIGPFAILTAILRHFLLLTAMLIAFGFWSLFQISRRGNNKRKTRQKGHETRGNRGERGKGHHSLLIIDH